MAFTFSIIEWAAVLDPAGLFRQGGQSEGEIGSGGETGTSTVAFASRATAQLTTATRAGADDFPDDGGARLAQPVTLNGTTFGGGATVEADFEMILQDPQTGLYFRATWLAIDNQPVGVTISRGWNAQLGRYRAGDEGLYPPGRLLTLIDGDDLQQSPNLADFTRSASFLTNGAGLNARLTRDGAVICFVAGTLIATPSGDRPVETLRRGDAVLTRDHGAQPIRWIGRRRVEPVLLGLLPRLRPIHIAAGALGIGLPQADLRLSPQHRVLVRSTIAQRMFGADEVLVAARHLAGLPGIATDGGGGPVDYWHFACDAHEIVAANGTPAETLHPGPEALRSVGPAARAELLTLFPDLGGGGGTRPLARPCPSGRQGRSLARRHLRNDRPLLV
ncbi:Hint domain-containing protein [Paracoccus spongiarum]|uniref:Hint domain-containing protein n=1 Tax=Paracoccus spongiarum TaxID=3064387 RepID=A0ABT9J7V5_9RHOB|nr:Hint domain-containing protein [Paracoccus sp. 2205BS29-5]MDP5305888.1 Hint domain-containing protein [Paracoccus sp. 2205BS29-5]